MYLRVNTNTHQKKSLTFQNYLLFPNGKAPIRKAGKFSFVLKPESTQLVLIRKDLLEQWREKLMNASIAAAESKDKKSKERKSHQHVKPRATPVSPPPYIFIFIYSFPPHSPATSNRAVTSARSLGRKQLSIFAEDSFLSLRCYLCAAASVILRQWPVPTVAPLCPGQKKDGADSGLSEGVRKANFDTIIGPTTPASTMRPCSDFIKRPPFPKNLLSIQPPFSLFSILDNFIYPPFPSLTVTKTRSVLMRSHLTERAIFFSTFHRNWVQIDDI